MDPEAMWKIAIVFIVVAIPVIILFSIRFSKSRFYRLRDRDKRMLRDRTGRLKAETAKADLDLNRILDKVPGCACGGGACPKCGTGLGSASFGGIDIPRCGSCSGLFVPLALLEKMLASMLETDDDGRPGELVEYLRMEGGKTGDTRACPRCGCAMSKKIYPALAGTSLDFCWPCSAAWFDGGELVLLSKLDPGTGGMEGGRPDKELRSIARLRRLAEGGVQYDDFGKPRGPDFAVGLFLHRYNVARLEARRRRSEKG